MEGRGLLGNSSSFNARFVAGTLGVAGIAAVALASTSSGSLYAPVAPTTSVLSRPAAVNFVNVHSVHSTSAAAAKVSETTTEENSFYTTERSASWTPLVMATTIPLTLVGLFTMFRSKKTSILDPMDMTTASGPQWTMMVSAGEAAVARNYANALIELGQEGKCLEQLHGDMENFGSILSDETFSSFFTNPLMTGDKQKEVIAKLCEEASMSPITKNFVSFLVDKRRIPYLAGIIKEFDEQFYEATGTQVATVTAAVALSEEQLRLIANKLHEMTKGKNIKIKSQVDPELLAGFVLEYGKSGSQRIDLSLRGQMNEMQEELKQGVRMVMSGGVPAAVQLAAVALGVNALIAGNASADSGNIFDFGLTMPIQMIQFLLLMVFLEKFLFTPVGKIMDERAEFIKTKSSQGASNTKEIAALNAKAEALLEAARKEAANELEDAKKNTSTQCAEQLAKTKKELDQSLKRSVAEIQRSRDELWAKLEEEVLPVLAEDICNKLLQEEPAAATAAKQ